MDIPHGTMDRPKYEEMYGDLYREPDNIDDLLEESERIKLIENRRASPNPREDD